MVTTKTVSESCSKDFMAFSSSRVLKGTDHGTDFCTGPEGFQQFEAIGQYGGDVVAFFNTQGFQCISQLIDAPVKLRVRETLFLEHHRQMIGAVFCVSGK